VCLAAVAARLCVGAWLLSAGPADFVLASDDGDAYDAAARWQAFGQPLDMTERLQGKWDATTESVVARWPQGYWQFLAAQYRVFGSPIVSTVVLQALIGAAGVVAAYCLAKKVLPDATARLATIGVAFSSTGVYLSAGLFAESLYVPLLLIALALIASTEGSRWWLPVLAGICFGLAEVTRPLALPVFLVAVAWSATARPARIPILVGLGFCVALAPFIARDQMAVFTAGASNAFRDQQALGAGLAERVFILFLTGGWAPLGEPLVSISNGVPRLVEWVLAAIGGVWLLLPRQRSAVTWLMLLASMAIVVPPLLIGLPLVRYRAAADPLFILYMAAALQFLILGLRRAVDPGHVSARQSRLHIPTA
jgi:Dolichyl-phosphate-mannose-protein mannosyltransferase